MTSFLFGILNLFILAVFGIAVVWFANWFDKLPPTGAYGLRAELVAKIRQVYRTAVGDSSCLKKLWRICLIPVGAVVVTCGLLFVAAGWFDM